MTVSELKEILSNDWIPGDLVIKDYNDNKIDDVNLQIESDGSVSSIRLSMSQP